jgi:hypothetical protein
MAACSSGGDSSTTTVAVTTTPTSEQTGTTGGTDTTLAPSTSDTQPSTTQPADTGLYSPLTGLPIASKADKTKPVSAIMIDNLAPARPQSGIKDGEVIMEAIAEAGITRFLVVYQQNAPALIGPVRSLRIYDIDWAVSFDASIGHVGGAPSALAEVGKSKYRDIDMFSNGSYYWRSKDRAAPHNVYTSAAKLAALNAKKGYTTSDPSPFSRVDGKASASPDATSISIHISGPAYDSTYKYDPATNTYARSQAGKPFLDREKGQVSPSVVVAMMVREWTVQEKSKIPTRQRIETIGSGKATIFQNGTATKVTWKKASQKAQITFTDESGNDVPLVRGQTWIVAVPNDKGSVSWE